MPRPSSMTASLQLPLLLPLSRGRRGVCVWGGGLLRRAPLGRGPWGDNRMEWRDGLVSITPQCRIVTVYSCNCDCLLHTANTIPAHRASRPHRLPLSQLLHECDSLLRRASLNKSSLLEGRQAAAELVRLLAVPPGQRRATAYRCARRGGGRLHS